MRPRIRTIKPEIHTDEELWDLEQQTGLPVFRAFVGLWSYADREGRFEWRPRPLKAAILPYWEGDFEEVLDALVVARFVIRYSVDGKTYGWVRTFTEHQVVNTREPPSFLPAPPDMCTHVRAREEHAHAQGEWELEREGNGKERAAAHPPPRVDSDPAPEVIEPVGRRSRFAPSDFQPNAEHRTRCAELRFEVEPLVKAFKRHEFKRDYTDWNRRFADWIEREKIIRETAQANAPRASPGADLDTTSAATVFHPTNEHRAFCTKHNLDLNTAVRAYRASPGTQQLGTVQQERDFMNRLKCWAAIGRFISDGPLPRRKAGNEAA